jgi:hypothetical protein
MQKKNLPLQKQLDKIDAMEAKMMERVRREAQKRRSVIMGKQLALAKAFDKQEQAIYRKAR